MSPPHNWPESLVFIASPRYHCTVPPSTRTLLTTGAPTAQNAPRHTANLVRIRSISDPDHPACGQRGLFALHKIPPRSHIIDYIGEVHCDDRPNSDYDLSLYRGEDGVSVGIDASEMGNEARFINDYRGIRDKPNAAFVDYRASSGELRMGIWSADKEIKKGQEILVSYGKSWWRCRITAI